MNRREFLKTGLSAIAGISFLGSMPKLAFADEPAKTIFGADENIAGYYTGRQIIMTSGDSIGEVRTIIDRGERGGVLSVTYPFTTQPSATDTFIIR